MMMIFDLKNYKKAKIIVRDLEKILDVFNANKKALIGYFKYVPVKDVYKCIINNQSILEIHLEKYKRIIENRGNISESELEEIKK